MLGVLLCFTLLFWCRLCKCFFFWLLFYFLFEIDGFVYMYMLIICREKLIVVLVKSMKNPRTALIKTSEVNEESKDCSHDQDLHHGFRLISSMPLVTVCLTPPPLMHLTNCCCNCCWRPHKTRRLFAKKQTRR
ncbi:hypothetical protein RchiOBHm_Chr2g0173731 [Rosa chinensis]|uniref:Uncharacterized protein n=1 Tax=Rosa chinensis TaxID=74649 RepID=A0A2P6S5Y9_ROSCH|nr:hypothetical protein RchiOBHm_Chr2g0173731 [Rosa chinensis]